MASDTETKAFPHLTPAYPHRTGLHHCDICYEGEHADIIAAPFPNDAGLRPMFRDERDGVMVCLRCAEAGDYLVIETGETEEVMR